MVDARVFVLGALGALLVVGLALGAESQRETFLHPDALQDVALGEAAGNLVVLTAFVPAMAVALAGALLSRVPWLRRMGPVLGLFLSTYLLVVMMQSSWPNYVAAVEDRTATFSITPLISNGDAVPTVFLGPIVVVLAAAFGIAASGRRLRPRQVADLDPQSILRRFLAAYALGAGFLIIVVLGNLRLLIALPDGQADTVPYLFVFPLSLLAAAGLLVTGLLKAWHLGLFVRNSRFADAASDAWSNLRRAEWVLAGILGGVALFATVLTAIPDDLLEAGRTFGLTTRGHAQMQFLLLVPLGAWLTMDAKVQDVFARFQDHGATLDVGVDRAVLATMAALVVGLAGASVALAMEGALWPWAAAFTPLTLLTWRRFTPQDAMWPSTVLAIVLWGIGNTVVGLFELNRDADNALSLADAPGVLALFRFLAILVAAVALARLARSHAGRAPLALLIAGAVGMLAFLELSFAAWIAPQSEGEFVGIGSLIASQDRAVRAMMHLLAGFGAFAAGIAVARIHRPDWFPRRGDPAPAEESLDAPALPPGHSAT
ncbi:MAG: hypothetical protein ACPHID_02090 [Thermoplasmatota archaeon]